MGIPTAISELADDTGGILAGILTEAELCAEMNWRRRTLQRRIRSGMPCIRDGHRKYFVISSVRQWLIGHEAQRSREPRGPGRPRGKQQKQSRRARRADDGE